MATIVAAVVAVAGAKTKSDAEKRAAGAASTQAMATHASNQSALIARAYTQSMQASAPNANSFDAARAGLAPGPGAGSGGGMGGGGLGNAAVMGAGPETGNGTGAG